MNPNASLYAAIGIALFTALLWFGPMRDARLADEWHARGQFLADCLTVSSDAECEAALAEFPK